LVRGRRARKASITNLSEIPEEIRFFFGDIVEAYDESAKKWIEGPTAQPALDGFIEVFSNSCDTGFGVEEIQAGLKTVIGSVGVGARKVLMPIRAALTGRTKGPELHVIMEILGRERSIKRAFAALQEARGNHDGATSL
jgi:nondiscriminating glutamyl-tRNA synthetase